MKILSLSLDNSVLDKASAAAARAVEYGALVEKYTVIAPSAKNEEITLSEKVKVYGSGGGNKLRQFFKIYQAAEKLLCQNKYQVITVQDQYYLALIGLRLSKKRQVGLEIQVHGFEKFYGLRKLIAKYVLPRANVVRCVSQRLKKRLISQFGVREEKITVVPIFVEVRSKKLEVRSEKNAERFIFLTAGRLVPVKNIGLQIEAMAEVIKKYKNIELWITGDGSERANLQKLSRELRLMSYVKFLGWQSDLSKYYEQADVFMLTSNAEGWPLVIGEAASHSLPIIITDVGSAGELIINNASGLIVPVGDKQKLAEAMLKIIEDENLRKKLGAEAKLAVSRLPNKEQILELYKKSWELALK